MKNDILFTGRWLDKSTNLYYYRARWYDAEDGRFVSKDPIGFDSGDWNLYRYVGNGVNKWIDPWGYWKICYSLPDKKTKWKKIRGPYDVSSWEGNGVVDDGLMGNGFMIWRRIVKYDIERTIIKRKLCFICENNSFKIKIIKISEKIERKTIEVTEYKKSFVTGLGVSGEYTTKDPDGNSYLVREGENIYAK